MKRKGHLFEEVADFQALICSARRAAKGKHLTPEAMSFLLDLEPEVLRLKRELLAGTYHPGSYRTFVITDPKPRTISAAPFRDRVVHHALCAALEPVFERYAIADSYACRVGKGSHAAVRRARSLARSFPWFLKLDVRKYFETLDHAVLKRLLRRQVKDRRLLDLADRFIDAGTPGSPAGKGVPIGNLTSQHFANFYLGPLDHLIKESLRVKGFCRYMDDVLIFGEDRGTLDEHLRVISDYLSEQLLLDLKDEATIRAPTRTGVPFLGFRIWPGLIRLDRYRVRRFRRRLCELSRRLDRGELSEDEAAMAAQSLVAWAAVCGSLGLRRSFLDRREH